MRGCEGWASVRRSKAGSCSAQQVARREGGVRRGAAQVARAVMNTAQRNWESARVILSRSSTNTSTQRVSPSHMTSRVTAHLVARPASLAEGWSLLIAHVAAGEPPRWIALAPSIGKTHYELLSLAAGRWVSQREREGGRRLRPPSPNCNTPWLRAVPPPPLPSPPLTSLCCQSQLTALSARAPRTASSSATPVAPSVKFASSSASNVLVFASNSSRAAENSRYISLTVGWGGGGEGLGRGQEWPVRPPRSLLTSDL